MICSFLKLGEEKICDLDWIRTNGLLLRRQLLYPAELPSQLFYFLNQ